MAEENEPQAITLLELIHDCLIIHNEREVNALNNNIYQPIFIHLSECRPMMVSALLNQLHRSTHEHSN